MDDARFIHIVGLYKCGTSWLSHIMAAHPRIIAWREFDVIRAVYRERPLSYLNRAHSHLLRRFHLPVKKVRGLGFELRGREEILRKLFCGQGWIPLMGRDKRDQAESLDYGDTEFFVDSLLSLTGETLRADDASLLEPGSHTNILGVVHTRKKDLVDFVEATKSTQDPSRIPAIYFDHLQRQCVPDALIVLKAADQVMAMRELNAISPRSKKIIIIRDGRDAAISAFHFQKLMKKWDSPWQSVPMSYLDQVSAWATRASAVAYHCKRDNLLVLRYEDLYRDFFSVCTRFFEKLGIPTTRADLEDIYQETDFTSVTGDRKPGESAEHLVRKGIIGEWKSTLADKDANLAWRIAGRELAFFGYSRSGEYRDRESCGATLI